MNETKIDWADFSWNPITGCKRGCSYCYARRLAKQRGWSFEPTFHEERMLEPNWEKESKIIFCCSMGEMFSPYVDPRWQVRIFDAMKEYGWHKYVVLTKERPPMYELPKNLWLGISVDQYFTGNMLAHSGEKSGTRETFHNRMFLLKKSRARRKIVCFEPLLDWHVAASLKGMLRGIDWVIVGGLTGGKVVDRIPKPWNKVTHKDGRKWLQECVGDIVSECRHEGVPVFVKSNAGYPEKVQEYPDN